MGYDTAFRAFAWTAGAYGCAGYLELWVQMPRLNGQVLNYYNDWVVAAPDYVDEHPAYPYYAPYSDVYAVSGRHRISISGPDVSSALYTFVAHTY